MQVAEQKFLLINSRCPRAQMCLINLLILSSLRALRAPWRNSLVAISPSPAAVILTSAVLLQELWMAMKHWTKISRGASIQAKAGLLSENYPTLLSFIKNWGKLNSYIEFYYLHLIFVHHNDFNYSFLARETNVNTYIQNRWELIFFICIVWFSYHFFFFFDCSYHCPKLKSRDVPSLPSKSIFSKQATSERACMDKLRASAQRYLSALTWEALDPGPARSIIFYEFLCPTQHLLWRPLPLPPKKSKFSLSSFFKGWVFFVTLTRCYIYTTSSLHNALMSSQIFCWISYRFQLKIRDLQLKMEIFIFSWR